MFSCFLLWLGLIAAFVGVMLWEDRKMGKANQEPRIQIQVQTEGGVVTAVYASMPMTVQVIDLDERQEFLQWLPVVVY